MMGLQIPGTPGGRLVEFEVSPANRAVCVPCQETSPLGISTLRWIDMHLVTEHQGFGEARITTR